MTSHYSNAQIRGGYYYPASPASYAYSIGRTVPAPLGLTDHLRAVQQHIAAGAVITPHDADIIRELSQALPSPTQGVGVADLQWVTSIGDESPGDPQGIWDSWKAHLEKLLSCTVRLYGRSRKAVDCLPIPFDGPIFDSGCEAKEITIIDGGKQVHCCPLRATDMVLTASREIAFRGEDKGLIALCTSVLSLYFSSEEKMRKSEVTCSAAFRSFSTLNTLSGMVSNEMELVISQLTGHIQKAIPCEQVRIYVLEDSRHESASVWINGKYSHESAIKESHLSHAFLCGITLNIVDVWSEPGYDTSVDRYINFRTKSCLVKPMRVGNYIRGVIELCNSTGKSRFDEDSERMMELVVIGGAMALRGALEYKELKNAQSLYRGFRQAAEGVLALPFGSVEQGKVALKLSEVLRRLVQCERCTVYHADRTRNVLRPVFADFLDLEFSLPFDGKSLASEAYRSRKIVNVKDAYLDPRFNNSIDTQTRFVTRSILTAPLYHSGEIVGVVQAINKLGRLHFSIHDEELFDDFGPFVASALLRSGLMDAAPHAPPSVPAKVGSEPNLAIPVLCKATITQEATAIMQLPLPSEEVERFLSREFDILKYDAADNRLPKLLLCIFERLQLIDQLELERVVLLRYILALRKFYRNVPYHNFLHAVDVVQTMFTILSSAGIAEFFTPVEKLVMLVSALAHDVDHMGLNNAYHLKVESPLGVLTTVIGSQSVLELHHCTLAIFLLSDEYFNVFLPLPSKQQTSCVKHLMNIILATDMSKHASLCKQLQEMNSAAKPKADATAPLFEKNVEEQNLLAMQFVMKASDVSNVAKPYDIYFPWGQRVLDEFGIQGDSERRKGFEVAPMFDRTKAELASSQILFIKFIMPMYKEVATAFPGLYWMFGQVSANLNKWLSTSPEPKPTPPV